MGTPLRITVWLSVLLVHLAVAAQATEPGSLDESQQDKVRAAACFATAKTLYEQGDLSGALQSYQRAWWWDQAQAAPLREIVPLAASLGQEDTAIRYALLQADHGAAEPEMLRRLALHATQQQDWDQAARLYRQWLDQSDPAGDAFQRSLILIEQGRLELLSNDAQAASRSFAEPQRRLLESPDSSLARRLTAALGGSLSATLETFGRCHLAADQAELAAEAITALAKSPDATTRTRYWLARIAIEQRRPLEALTLLRSYFENGDESLGDKPYELLLRTLVLLNEGDRFEEELQRLRGLQTHSPYPIAALARRADALGNKSAAQEHFQQLVDAASPESPVQLTEQLFAEAGGWLLREARVDRRPNQVLPLLTQLCQTDPLLSLFDDELEALMEDGELVEQLRTRLLLSVDSDDGSPISALAAHRLAMALDDMQTGLVLLKRALAEPDEDSPSVLMQAVIDFILADQPELAVQTLHWAREASIVPEDDADSWFYEATSLTMADEFEAALAAARKAAELAPDSAQFASHTAWVLQLSDRTDEAIAEYSAVVERFDDSQDLLTRESLAETRRTLSYLVLGQGNHEQAAELLQRVLDEFPEDAGALNDLGFQWADQGEHLQRAAEMLRQAVEFEPDNPAYLDSLGWAQFRLNQFDQALASIGRAIAIETAEGGNADPEILLHYGEVQRAAGRPDAAADTWRKALENLSEDDDRIGLADRLEESLSTLPQGDADGAPEQESPTEAP